MGLVTITYLPKPKLIGKTINEDNNCELTVTFNVTVGSNPVYVNIMNSDGFGSGAITETIAANKSYSVTITGHISSTTSMNTTTSVIDIVIRDGSTTGQVLDNDSISRTHSGNLC